jgi:enoyl-CoA hydratase
MEDQKVIYEKDGRVARIILNRPDKLNALDMPMVEEIDKAITMAEQDDDVRVLIIKGEGRAFCSGYDLDWGANQLHYRIEETKPGEKLIEKPSQRVRLRLDRMVYETMRHLFLCGKVTIAQAHGYCLAAGLFFVEKCDLIIGAEDCKFGYPEERLFLGGWSMSPMLVLRVGLTKALELSITGKMIDGKEAERIHLINRAVPADKLEAEVEETARAIGLYTRDGLALAKVTRHSVYDMLGLTQFFTTGTWSHTLLTYLEFPPGEYSFPDRVKEIGPSAAAHERDELVRVLDK